MSRWGRHKPKKEKDVDYPSVVEGLKTIYHSKIKPLEQTYQYHEFHSPLMRNQEFEAKPQVLMLGQYSTGKTTFIRYLLEQDFPGQHIGPEPTTDRFTVVMYGDHEMVTPGNALAVQSDKPFQGLDKFGNDFLNKLQGSQLPAPILEDITIIDTPGVLSGEKQRIGRSYDFPQVCSWFAERSDLILLLFDAHKLDISDEFKSIIEVLKGHDDKIRVILNKADMVSGQQLMRVYGALMWSLGKVLQTPEVVRVYIGSFWEEPYKNTENTKLFDAERADLLRDLHSLPRNATVRKVNELVKRARTAKVHAYIISHLRDQMPSVFGKNKKQEQLLESLKNEFLFLHKHYGLPPGDFPEISKFRDKLRTYDFSKFAKLQPKLIEAMDTVLADDIPKLMKKFPSENQPTNPFENIGSGPEQVITRELRDEFSQKFWSLNPVDGKVSGKVMKQVMQETELPTDILSKIWVLSDRDKDGFLTEGEFICCQYLMHSYGEGNPLPKQVPQALLINEGLISPPPETTTSHSDYPVYT